MNSNSLRKTDEERIPTPLCPAVPSFVKQNVVFFEMDRYIVRFAIYLSPKQLRQSQNPSPITKFHSYSVSQNLFNPTQYALSRAHSPRDPSRSLSLSPNSSLSPSPQIDQIQNLVKTKSSISVERVHTATLCQTASSS